MKQGDFGTKLIFTILDENDDPLDLTGATEINLIIKLDDDRLERTCTVEDTLGGIVSYTIQPDELDVYGTLKMEVEIVFGTLRQFTTSTVKENIKKKL